MTAPVSVVLPTRDRPAMLERCLAGLAAALGPDDQLVVVDSASTDPAVGQVARDRAATVLAGWPVSLPRPTLYSSTLPMDMAIQACH